MPKLSRLVLTLHENQVVCTVTPCRKVVVYENFISFRIPSSGSLQGISKTIIGKASCTVDLTESSLYVLGKVTKEHVEACHSALTAALADRIRAVQEDLQNLSKKMDVWKGAESALLYSFTHNH